MARYTPLYELHKAQGARMVDFAGWEMPLHYGSQVEEHHAVRRAAGMFDVSHMTILDVQGNMAQSYLRYVLANDVAKLKQPGKALYSAMLNTSAGVIDDLIVYYLALDRYRLVLNAATRDKDIAWLTEHAVQWAVTLSERTDLALLAIQGPDARRQVESLLLPEYRQSVAALKAFHCLELDQWLIATTGYTGEAGYEIALPVAEAVVLWRQLLDRGIQPAGLGARDTLRLEAGMNLYGQDMDEQVSPLAANMGWTISWQPEDRQFIGREALHKQSQQLSEQQVGLILEQQGILRQGMIVTFTDSEGSTEQGVITSGSFSPTLGLSIALARVPITTATSATVEIRKNNLPVRVTKPVFVRDGKPWC